MLRERPLHAQLCEVLVHTKELLARLEAKGVYVPRDAQQEILRLEFRGIRADQLKQKG
jgi:hypothetical protein